jgi:hypothetical protein
MFDGGAGVGVALSNLTGAFSMTGSTVTSTGGGFRIEGGNGTVSHDGAVTQTGAASAIDIRNRTGGSVSFGGPVTANSGTATGINLQNNAGTIAFTGGLDIDTTTGTGFSATGGGTVNVSNGAVANSVNATAGQAINIDGVGGSMTFSTIASTNAPGDGIAIDNFGAGSTFQVTGATTVTTAGQDGIDIDNTAGTVTFAGPVTIATPTDDGVDMDDVTGTVTFSGPVTITNPGDDGIDVEDSFNATLAFNGPVAITSAGGNGIELNGPGGAAPTTGTLTFGGSTTITNPTLAGVLAVDRIGTVTFADLDIALQTDNSAGLVLAGATINGNFTATDFDVTSTTNTGTAGVVLSGTTGPGTIRLGDTDVAGASASIAGVASGVVFNAASNATFIFGDGESATDQGSSISATTAIQGGSTVTMGSYNFDDVTFTGTLDFTAGGGNGLVFVAATATGDGSGSDVNNRANVITADAITTANTTFVLINDGAAIDDLDGFTLSNDQTMASFGNGRTFVSSGLIIPANFSGIPGGGAAITDPTGNGAATLTNTGAGDTLTALGNVTLQDFIIENTAGGDGLTGTGAIGINSTGLTIRNITGGQGIDLNNVTGTVTFNDTRVATTAGNGVDIANSSVSFTGILDIDTAAGIGLNATGGSTLSVAATAGDQSITSTAGQALNLDTVTIGAGGVNFDSVSSTNAGNGNAGIRLNALTGPGGVTITNARVVDSGGATGGNGIELAGIGTTGALTIANIDIDMPTTGGNNLRGISSTGGHTSDINLGTGAGGVAIDDTALGIQLTGTAGTINIGTGAGSGGVQINTLGNGINIGNNATGTINIGNTATTSVIDAGNVFATQSAIALNQADATVTVTGIDINGAGTGAAGHGIHVLDNDAVGSFTLNGTNTIDNTGGDGIRIDGGNAMISGVTIGASATGVGDDITGNGVNVLDNGQNISVSIDTVTVADARGAGIRVDGSGAGSVTINSFNNNTVTDADVRGVDILDATFDAVTGGAVQQVTGGNLSVGAIGDRVEGDGVRLDQVLGDIGFGTVDIFNNNGTGLFIRDAAGKGGAFAFGNTGGTIDTTNGAAVDIDPVTMSSTFANLTSTNSAGRGVNLDTIAGTFTVTGTTSVTGSTTQGVRVINSTAAINLGTLNVNGTTGTAVLIQNNGGGSFTATGGTVTKGGVAGDALDINGGAMAVNFGANISHTSNGGDAVSIRGGTTGNITVSGTIANTTGGRAIDINTVTGGTVSFTGATVTDTIGIQIANVAAGANVNFSAGTTVTLNNPGVAGINLSDNAGAIAFNGAVDINNAGASGIVLVNANANVTFGQVDIDLGAGAANADAISIGGTPGTLTFGVTTITNVGAAANQKGIDFSGTTLGGAVNFESVAISGPDTSTSSIGIDLTGVLGNQFVNIGNQANPAAGPSSSITDLHRGVVIDNTAAVQFTFGDGESPNDTGSSINVNGQAGAFTVDVGGGTLAASSFDFNDVAFGAGDSANLPATAGSVVFVSQTGGVIAATTHGLSQALNTITVAAADALTTSTTFVFVGNVDIGGANGTGGTAFSLANGQSINGFGNGNTVNFGTTQPANVEGNLGATGGAVTGNQAIVSNSTATNGLFTIQDGAVRNTAFDFAAQNAGVAMFANTTTTGAITFEGITVTNVGAGRVFLDSDNNNNAAGIAIINNNINIAGTLLDVDGGSGSITVTRGTLPNSATPGTLTVGQVDIAAKTGGTVNFTDLTVNSGTQNAVSLVNNAGATFNFNGDLAINGSSGTGLNATGGGTVNVAAAGNATITSTSGQAINLDGVTTNISFDSVTGTGAGGTLDGILLNNLVANSTFAVTGTTTLDNYADAGIQISNLANNNQDIDFGATDINRNTAVATGRGIVIDSIGGTGVDIDFGATQVGQGTTTTMGILVSGVGAGATGFRTDFASVNVSRARTGISINNVDGGGVGVTGTTLVQDAETANLTVQGSDANVTFGDTFGAQNNSGFDGRLVGIGNTTANTGTVTFASQATLTASGTAAGEGVNLGGGTATFSGGLDIDTVTGTGLDATATGGTLNVAMTAGDESITTTSGQAVRLQNATINAVFDTITGTGAAGGTVTGISIFGTGAGSSFAVTGTTTLNNYTSEGIGIDFLTQADQTIAFGAVDINTTVGSVQATGDGIRVATVSATGVDIDFGAVTVGNATNQSADGVRIENITDRATGFDLDFASLSITNVDLGFLVNNFDAPGASTVTLAGTTTIAANQFNGIRIFNSDGDVTFGGQTTVTNSGAGIGAGGVDLGDEAGGANTGIYTFNGLDVTVNGAGAFGLRATNTGTLNITGGTNDIVSNNGTAVFINPTVTNITLQNVTSNNATGSGVDLTLSGMSTFTVTGTTAVTGSDQAGVEITNSGGSTVSLGTLNIDNDGAAADGAGLVVNQGGAGTLNLNATAGTIASGNDAAIDIRNTSTGGVNLGVTLTSVSVNGAAEGINIENTGGGTMTGAFAVSGTTSVANTTADAINIDGYGGTTSFGATSITNPGAIGIDINGTNGAIGFGDVDITSLANNTTGVDLRTTSGTVTFATLDVSSAAVTTGTRGIDLRGAANASNMTTTNPSTINNLAIGVDLTNANITGTFRFGDGSAPTASNISNTTTAIEITGVNSATGTYNFEDVAFPGSGTTNLSGGGGSTVFWAAAVATGAGDGSSAANAGTIAAADASTNDVIVLLDNAGGGGQDIINLGAGAFGLGANQQLISFRNQDSFTIGGGAPSNIQLTGISGSTTITNPNTGSGAPVLVSSGATTLTMQAGGIIDGIEISNTNTATSVVILADDVAGSITVRNSLITAASITTGIEINHAGGFSGTTVALITGNTINYDNRRAIDVDVRGSGRVDLTATNNMIDAINTTSGNGITLLSGDGTAATVCANIRDNTVTDGGQALFADAFGSAGSIASLLLEDFTGPADDTGAAVTYLNDRNSFSGKPVVVLLDNATMPANPAACATP